MSVSLLGPNLKYRTKEEYVELNLSTVSSNFRRRARGTVSMEEPEWIVFQVITKLLKDKIRSQLTAVKSRKLL